MFKYTMTNVQTHTHKCTNKQIHKDKQYYQMRSGWLMLCLLGGPDLPPNVDIKETHPPLHSVAATESQEDRVKKSEMPNLESLF